jgi:hypothetical protein
MPIEPVKQAHRCNEDDMVRTSSEGGLLDARCPRVFKSCDIPKTPHNTPEPQFASLEQKTDIMKQARVIARQMYENGKDKDQADACQDDNGGNIHA